MKNAAITRQGRGIVCGTRGVLAQQYRFETRGVRAKFFLAFPIVGKQRMTFLAN
jgi:hypothetical protein